MNDLACGIRERFGKEGDPLALSRVTVLLPTRRAVRALAEAFLAVGDASTSLLPCIRPIGDVDEDELVLDETYSFAAEEEDLEIPPAIGPLRRQILLINLLQPYVKQLDLSPHDVAAMAADLAALFDQIQAEQADISLVAEIVPQQFATHWQHSLVFLNLIAEHWPKILEEEGALDPNDRRNRLLNAYTERLSNNPPADPIIVAGSTGSIRATADLIDCVARLPLGLVVLPGLDVELEEDGWEAIAAGHAQFGLKELLTRMQVDRDAVSIWRTHPAAAEKVRARLINESLRPWQTTGRWKTLGADISQIEGGTPALFRGVARVDADDMREEAAVIAFIMRETLETPGTTGALVTPNRDLARRVSAELRKWDLDIDDSAGLPLIHALPMVFLRLVLSAVEENFSPISLLSVLKHPLCALGEDPAVLRRQARELELGVLRGPRPSPGLDGLRHAIAESDDRQQELLDRLEEAFTPLVTIGGDKDRSIADLATAHIETCEALAGSNLQTGAERIWSREAGEAAALYFSELLEASDDRLKVDIHQYRALLEVFGHSRLVRQRGQSRTRLSIWGPMEARLQSADVMILGGLNENSWPQDVGIDPWLSRPMRRALGLSEPETRIGLAAHDFLQGATAPNVFLTRSEKVDGAPTVPSRWLMRLSTLAEGLDLKKVLEPAKPYISWVRELDRAKHLPKAKRQSAEPPTPKPAVAHRPRSLSVTQIETLIRDPYAIYARHVLGLRVLRPIDDDLGPMERGSLVHEALHQFVDRYPGDDDALRLLLEIGEELFADNAASSIVQAAWRPRFGRLAEWFSEYEMARHRHIAHTRTEISGAITFQAPAGPFELHGRADRIDRLKDGSIDVIDYKTGNPPRTRQVESGLAPQLPLEAAMASLGGFGDEFKREIGRLLYIKVSGGRPPGEELPVGGDAAKHADATLEGLKRLVARYDIQETPYNSRVTPMFVSDIGDYDHLARVKEWTAVGAAEDEI